VSTPIVVNSTQNLRSVEQQNKTQPQGDASPVPASQFAIKVGERMLTFDVAIKDGQLVVRQIPIKAGISLFLTNLPASNPLLQNVKKAQEVFENQVNEFVRQSGTANQSPTFDFPAFLTFAQNGRTARTVNSARGSGVKPTSVSATFGGSSTGQFQRFSARLPVNANNSITLASTIVNNEGKTSSDRSLVFSSGSLSAGVQQIDTLNPRSSRSLFFASYSTSTALSPILSANTVMEGIQVVRGSTILRPAVELRAAIPVTDSMNVFVSGGIRLQAPLGGRIELQNQVQVGLDAKFGGNLTVKAAVGNFYSSGAVAGYSGFNVGLGVSF
jgi:hypothetical protein